MRIIDKHIVKNLILATVVIVILVVGIDVCVTFMVEQGDVGKGDYTLLNAFQFAVMTAPSHITAGFPVICLVGMVIGLSLLNLNNEIVIIRTNGYSLFKICSIAVLTSLMLSFLMLCVNEWLAPVSKQNAEIHKALAKSGGHALRSKYGFWLRVSGDFVHIEKILYDGELEHITRYKVKNSELMKVTYAARARYEHGVWHAYDVKTTTFNNDDTNSEIVNEEIWQKFLKPEFLRVVSIDPEDLSLSGLYKYIQYRKQNDLYYEQYELAFWQKILQPITVMVMVFLAVPFVFAEIRSTAVSKRLILSILVGVSYFLLEKFFVSVVQFFSMPLIVGALGPAFTFILMAVWWLARSRWRLT